MYSWSEGTHSLPFYPILFVKCLASWPHDLSHGSRRLAGRRRYWRLLGQAMGHREKPCFIDFRNHFCWFLLSENWAAKMFLSKSIIIFSCKKWYFPWGILHEKRRRLQALQIWNNLRPGYHWWLVSLVILMRWIQPFRIICLKGK